MARQTDEEKKARAKKAKKNNKLKAELVPVPGFPGAFTTKGKGKVTPKGGKVWGMTPEETLKIRSGFQDRWKI